QITNCHFIQFEFRGRCWANNLARFSAGANGNSGDRCSGGPGDAATDETPAIHGRLLKRSNGTQRFYSVIKGKSNGYGNPIVREGASSALRKVAPSLTVGFLPLRREFLQLQTLARKESQKVVARS